MAHVRIDVGIVRDNSVAYNLVAKARAAVDETILAAGTRGIWMQVGPPVKRLQINDLLVHVERLPGFVLDDSHRDELCLVSVTI